jgi:hypothetical protein
MLYAKAPVQKLVQSTHNNVQYGRNNVVKGGNSDNVTKSVTSDTENPTESKKYVYRNNYNGKYHMPRGGGIKGLKRVCLQKPIMKWLTLKENWSKQLED